MQGHLPITDSASPNPATGSDVVPPSPVTLSVISPVYRAQNIVAILVEQIIEYVSPLVASFEIILVEDGSPDASWLAIEQACTRDERVKGIRLARNFGQHYAITAGLAAAKGEWVIVMDCDLQDRPDQIPLLWATAQQQQTDIVLARRVNRTDGFLKRLSSKAYYSVFSYLTQTKQNASIANFGIYHRKVIDAVLGMGDTVRYLPTMIQWVGFRRQEVDVRHGDREEGESSYNWSSLLALAFNNIIAFSDRPLRLMIRFGLAIIVFAVILAVYNLVLYFRGITTVPGYASLIISIWFLAGVLVSLLGVLGLYLGKLFDQVKNRPVYLEAERLNF